MTAADQHEHGCVATHHWHTSLARTSAWSNELILAGQYHAFGFHRGAQTRARRATQGSALKWVRCPAGLGKATLAHVVALRVLPPKP